MPRAQEILNMPLLILNSSRYKVVQLQKTKTSFALLFVDEFLFVISQNDYST